MPGILQLSACEAARAKSPVGAPRTPSTLATPTCSVEPDSSTLLAKTSERTSLNLGRRRAIVGGKPHAQRIMFRPTSLATKIWTITEIGAEPQIMEMYGSRESVIRIGPLITTVIGATSNLGVTRGFMTSRGDLHHSIMGDGSTIKEPGAGCLRRRAPKALHVLARCTRP